MGTLDLKKGQNKTAGKTLPKPYVNEVLRVIYERRAVRKYKSTPVSRELLNQLLDAGRMAPSAINKQPWKFYVLTDQKTIMRYSGEIKRAAARHFLKAGPREILKNSGSLLHFPKGLRFLAEEDPVFHGAPVVIFITSPRSNEWSDLDVGMCAQNIMLAAKSLGLASCPVGFGKFIEEAPSFHELGVGKSERVNISLVIGTGDEEPEVHERKRDNAVYL